MDTVIHPVVVLDHYSDTLYQAVGARAASRACVNSLRIPSPPAFAITQSAFYQCLNTSNLLNPFIKSLHETKPFDVEQVSVLACQLQNYIKKLEFAPAFIDQVTHTYNRVIGHHWAHLTISPTPQTKAPVNLPLPVIKGEISLLDFLRQIWGIQISPHALSLYLQSKKNDMFPLTAVVVSQFEPAISSGKVYSVDPITHDKNICRIEAIWGTNPQNDPQHNESDIYALTKNGQTLITRNIYNQKTQIKTDRFGHYKEEPVPAKKQYLQKIDQKIIHQLQLYAQKIHNHQMKPVVVNWLQTDAGLFVTRFEASRQEDKLKMTTITPASRPDKKVIAMGLGVSPGIVTAPVTTFNPEKPEYLGRIVILKEPHLANLKALKASRGIIIESGGMNSELVTACRETGLPVIVGTGRIVIPPNGVFTLDAGKGTVSLNTSTPTSKIPETIITSIKEEPLQNHARATKIYLHLSDYQPTDEAIYQRADGISSCRGNQLLALDGNHPRWWLDRNPKKLEEHLVDKLKTICQSFGDRTVWYHLFDLSSREAASLNHGQTYEPQEYNSSIGFRGAYRIMHNSQLAQFEFKTLASLRHKYQCQNLSLVIPFVRSVKEFQTVKRLAAAHQLSRSASFKIAAEIVSPSVISWLPELADSGLDALHVNLDYIAMLLYGYDANSSEVDQNLSVIQPAVTGFVAQLVSLCNLYKLPLIVSAAKLDQQKDVSEAIIKLGVTQIGVNPSQFDRLTYWVFDIEKKVVERK